MAAEFHTFAYDADSEDEREEGGYDHDLGRREVIIGPMRVSGGRGVVGGGGNGEVGGIKHIE